jgi:hypothetical protein
MKKKDLEVLLDGLSEAELRKASQVKKIISQTAGDVCLFYTYAEVLAQENCRLSERKRLYGYMLEIRDKYKYPSLYNKLVELEEYLKK